LQNKRPLVDTGSLKESIHWQLDGGTLYIGTNWGSDQWGASMHQWGASGAGRGRNVTIPARPFLGLSAEDETAVRAILDRHLAAAVGQ
jgi:phage gpG-like protein